MKTLVTICALLCMVSAASATIVNFDDLATPTTGSGIANWGLVPTNYAGLTWTGFEVVNGNGAGNNYKTIYNNTYDPTSSPNFAYNGGDGNLTTLVSSTLFDFLGADFTSYVQNNAYQSWSAHYITLKGYIGSSSTPSFTLTVNPLPTNGFTAVAANFMGINKLEIQSESAGRYWGMDNFTYTPEPATIAVLGLGAMGLLRRKHAA